MKRVSKILEHSILRTELFSESFQSYNYQNSEILLKLSSENKFKNVYQLPLLKKTKRFKFTIYSVIMEYEIKCINVLLIVSLMGLYQPFLQNHHHSVKDFLF